MFSEFGNDQYYLMEYGVVRFFHTRLVLIIDSSSFSSPLIWAGFLRVYRADELPLKEAAECELARNFCKYFGISGSVLAQQSYTTARHCFWKLVGRVGNSMTDWAASSLSLAVFCPALIRHGFFNRLSEMISHFGSTLAARGVLTDVELGKLLAHNLKRSEQLKHHRRKDVGCRSWTMWCVCGLVHPVGTISRCAQGVWNHACVVNEWLLA